MALSRLARLGASFLLSSSLAAGLASSALAQSPAGSDPGAQTATAVTYNIKGIIAGSAGVPMGGAIVAAQSASSSPYVTSGVDGSYSIAVVPGTYKLYVAASNPYLHGYYVAGFTGNFSVDANLATAISVASADVTGKNVQVPTGFTISGKVTGDAAAPLSNVHVLASSTSYTGNMWTPGDGTYSIVVAPSSSYTLTYADPSGTYLFGYYDSGAIGGGHFTLSSALATPVAVGTSNVTGVDVQMLKAPPWSVTLTVSAANPAVGAAVKVTATASEQVEPTYYYIVILDSHGTVVEHCGNGLSCAIMLTRTVAGSETYHAVIGNQDGSAPIATSDYHTVTWNPGSANHFGVSTVSPQVSGVAHTLTITARDSYGNTATGYTGSVHFTSSDAHAVLPADYHFVAADKGVHKFTITLKTAGTQWVRATDTVTAATAGVQNGIVVNPAAANHFGVSTVSPYVAGVTHTLTITARDASNNTATGYTGTVHFTSSDAHAVLPADYHFVAADKGVHKFTITLKTAGTQWVRATDTVTSATAGVQNGIVVTAAAATHLGLSSASAYAAGGPRTMTITARDAYGNVATGYRGTIHITSSDAAAVLPANYTFTAADNGTHAFLDSITLETTGTQWVRATDVATPAITGIQNGIQVEDM